jgi:predicted transposase YbfD/YdcC
MDVNASSGFLRFFSGVCDPRGRNAIHNLHDIIVITIMAIICGADDWVHVRLWAKGKLPWLCTFLELPGGIPSHDTFGRVFSLLDPDAFERCFLEWMASVVELSEGRLVAIDGKALRHSFERGWNKNAMTHLVSAFVTQGDNHLIFSQVAVEEKENEIIAIPRLLDLLDLKGAVVTIDAIGCQRDIAEQIVKAGGDYILPVKDNQPALHAKVEALMNDLILDHEKKIQGTQVGYFEKTEEGHGRIETRKVWVSPDISGLGKNLLDQWTGLGSIILVERTRQDLGDFSGKVSVERCHYISTISGIDAELIGGHIRGHWSIENKVHWQLDISFNEDKSRVRKGHAAENYSRLNRIALNVLKRETTLKASVKGKRLYAGWHDDYLLKLMGQ